MLRLASSQEARELAEMSRDLIEHGLGWRYTPLRMKGMIADPDSVTLVACEAASIQGFASMQFGDDEAHLSLLCVRPASRRRGIGASLLGWLTRSAEVAGMAAIQLELRADNAAALAFYGRLGFTETGFLPAYYDGLYPALRMSRSLREPSPSR